MTITALECGARSMNKVGEHSKDGARVRVSRVTSVFAENAECRGASSVNQRTELGCRTSVEAWHCAGCGIVAFKHYLLNALRRIRCCFCSIVLRPTASLRCARCTLSSSGAGAGVSKWPKLLVEGVRWRSPTSRPRRFREVDHVECLTLAPLQERVQ